MKKSFLIFAILFFNNCFAQNDLELKIINDTIKKVSIFDNNNIIYSLKNNSNKNYLVILDSEEFNEDGDYNVEPMFIGLPDFYVFEKQTLLVNSPAFHHGTNKFNINTSHIDFTNFEKSFSKLFSERDIEIAYRVNKNIINLKSGEVKYFSTRVDFPAYKSRSVDLKNKSEYYFQMSLQVPKDIVEKYFQPIYKKNDNEVIFVGQIFSNKIPLHYEVYNDK